MEIFHWVAEHGFDLVGVVGIIASLLFTAVSFHKDDRSRKIGNLIAITQQHRDVWQQLYERPGLARILKTDVDLGTEPISGDEFLFVKLLILHLDTVYRAMKAGTFVKLEGLQDDIAQFMSLPIPKFVWDKLKPLRDADFITFVENCVYSHKSTASTLK